ncbi:DUF6976 family protein [Delftia sp. PS-11]|uniref:DUF6976 family protein n=1 Tax=Delftia sp. PS-11 TaxID=2767222 RepID=UPI002453B235|nr:hypothetical protein [Delftia sp. PS-11]KAJ8741645.1 hypothetical protein H9T68_21680 [Delftia sp. PS-11]
MNQLISVQAAADLIRSGKFLSVAGPEKALDQLPAGQWVGGTIPYFMVDSGGVVVQDDAPQVFVSDLSSLGQVSFAAYGAEELAGITGNAPGNGFALTIIPAGGDVHRRFAADAATYESAFLYPTVGWIAGVHLSDIGRVTPKVYDGRTASKFEDRAVVAYVQLPDDKLASVEIVNLFEADGGDLLQFEETSFTVGDCLVNGRKTRFADYIRERGLEGGQLPLVGDYAGARINVSLQSVGAAGGDVQLYAPVFPGIDYHFAKPVPDYVAAFKEQLAQGDADGVVWSCNCILNFVFGELEGKAIGGVQGPVTFGEIAYQLLNQTQVAVRIQ